MIRTTYPGVYVQELPSGVRTITGVSTSVAAFVGRVDRGKLDTPTRVLSFPDYERSYGADTGVSEMTDQVRQFFLNGGQQAFIMRIANGAQPAAVTLQNEDNSAAALELVACDAGVIGDSIRIEVDYRTSSPESTFNLTAFRSVPDGTGGTTREAVETFTELSMDPGSARFAVDIISQQSALLDVPDDFVPGGTAFSGYAIAGRIESDANLLGEVVAAIPPGESLDFRASIDGGAFQTVVVTGVAAAAAPNLVSLLDTSIDNAHLGSGRSVSVSFSNDHLLIQSDAPTGSVRLRQGTTATLAEILGLGLDRGGLEVSGFAARRPAPSGVFQPLGDLTAPAVTGMLDDLGALTPVQVAGYEIEDALSPPTHIQSAVFAYAGATLREDAGGDASLGQLQNSLDQIVARINADAEDDDTFSWSAERVGFRIILSPEFGGSDTTADSAETTPGGIEFVPNVAEYRLNGNLGRQVGGAPGVDGDAPIAEDYERAFNMIDSEVDLFNLMVLPRASDQGDADMDEIWGIASVFCQQQRAFLIVDPRHSWETVDQVDDEIVDVRIGLATDHAAIYWPQLAISDAGVTRNIAPSGSIAGLMARTDSTRGVWKAPAGTEATIRGVRGVEHLMSDDQNGLINPAAVNAIRVFPNGIVSWGARTMVGFDNSGNDDYKYVPIRRFALFMEESLYRGLRFAVFEPNDEPLWAQIRLAAGAFMNNLFRQGAFQGQKASDAYFVKCDADTTIQNDINLGIVNVLIGFAPLKPAEFVIISIQQIAGQIST